MEALAGTTIIVYQIGILLKFDTRYQKMLVSVLIKAAFKFLSTSMTQTINLMFRRAYTLVLILAMNTSPLELQTKLVVHPKYLSS